MALDIFFIFLFNNLKGNLGPALQPALNMLMCYPWEETFAAASYHLNHQEDDASAKDGDDDDD